MTKNRKAVVVSGNRTPFARAFGTLVKFDTIGLGAFAVKGLLHRTELDPKEIDAVYWSGAILPGLTPNVGREIILEAGLPPTIDGFTVSRACSSSMLSVSLAAAAIERGEADVIIAGGGDSVSNAAVSLPEKVMQTFGPVVMGKKSSPLDWVQAVAQLAPFTDVIPKVPKVAERSTGQLMGESAEEMARRNKISREAQDEFALRSHVRTNRAWKSGRFENEVTPLDLSADKTLYQDEIVRGDTTFEKLSKLRPVFAKNGTLTAGNSSALTDGAGGVLLMSEEKARSLGYTPLARVSTWHYSAVDPTDQLLSGPAYSIPAVLTQRKMQYKDIDLVDIHEAFAGQVLALLKMLSSKTFAESTGLAYEPFDITPDVLNVHGGSIAIGHPFGATGARMITTMANEIHEQGKENALLGICAAGGLGAAMLLENVGG